MFKKSAFIAVIILLLATILPLIRSQPLTIVAWIDMLFICSILTTVIGAVLLIIQSKFFEPFVKSLKYFFQKINKQRQIADEIERKESNSYSRSIHLPMSIPLIGGGLVMLVLSIFISYLII